MAIVKFPSPIEWEGETYSEVDTDQLELLKGKDKLIIMQRLRRRKIHDVMQPEMDERYLLSALERATKIPEDVFGELPMPVFNELLLEAQGSLLGSALGLAATTSET